MYVLKREKKKHFFQKNTSLNIWNGKILIIHLRHSVLFILEH